MTARVGLGVIGLGFIGERHVQAIRAAALAGEPCELVAVCDADASRCAAVPEATAHASASALLADERVGAVSICTYTESHVPLAMAALDAGKHVLVEKPVALTAEGVRTLLARARGARALCMPAMCMRFWPGWDWLRERIIDGRFGAVRSARFERLGSPPAWAPDFYADSSRSGGALVDLHLHDVDFITWCFGRPERVMSAGSLAHLTTAYRFAGGPVHVVAEGGWGLTPGAPFRMRYTVCFEHATADFDIARTPALMLHGPEGSREVALPALTGYDGEVRHFVRAITCGARSAMCSLDEAMVVAEVIDAERRSLSSGMPERP